MKITLFSPLVLKAMCDHERWIGSDRDPKRLEGACSRGTSSRRCCDADKRLFLVGTPLADRCDGDSHGTTDGNVQLGVGETLATTLKDQRRVTFTRTRDGDYITAIEVKLDSENWDTDATKLQITFIDTTVPIPDSLVYPDNDTAHATLC